jgi:hypothetical protein
MTEKMSASRTVPGEAAETFAWVLPMPLPTIFTRWHGPLPPIRSTEGPEPWQSPGQQRRVNLVGPGWMRETLLEVAPPHHFDYRLDQIHGPMRALVAGVVGQWAFAPDGDGTRVTWSWVVTGRAATSWLLPTFARLWQGYAAKVLHDLEQRLGDHLSDDE